MKSFRNFIKNHTAQSVAEQYQSYYECGCGVFDDEEVTYVTENDYTYEAIFNDLMLLQEAAGDSKTARNAAKIAKQAARIAANEKKRVDTARPRIQAIHDTYGAATPEPPSEAELKGRISKRFEELSAMSPQQRKAEYSQAKERAKKARVSHPLDGNDKTDTAQDIPTHTAPHGHIALGMSMTPDTARHYTSADCSSYKERNTCSGSTTGCRQGCLAKHGNYEFATNKGHMDVRTQSMTHNPAATADHATRVYQALESASSKAKKQGKQVLTRFSVTDDTGSNVHADAVAKHFPDVVQMGYTKRLSTPHDPSKKIHTIFSDTGPMVNRSGANGMIEPNEENIKRRNVIKKATVDKGMPSYVVFNKRRPRHEAGPDDPDRQVYNETLSRLHTVRRYEPHPSQPSQGEAAEYHNPKGHGRVVAKDGQSYRYQDHPVADKIKDVHGNSLFPADHDARNVDHSTRTFHSPEGKPVGHVVAAFATASTSNRDLQSSGFFHHTENIDKSGVYHDGHPDEMASARANAAANAPKVTNGPTSVAPPEPAPASHGAAKKSSIFNRVKTVA